VGLDTLAVVQFVTTLDGRVPFQLYQIQPDGMVNKVVEPRWTALAGAWLSAGGM